eukprot:m.166181 g.166181  ORF g.166181 m.166181 type:complete len:104 (-) comp53140_c0_seq9:618-929(-)
MDLHAYKRPAEDSASTLRQQTNGPSRVLHVRSMPENTTVHELHAILAPLGTVTNVMLIKGKNQAFVEFQTVHQATNVLTHWAAIPFNAKDHHFHEGRHVSGLH